ncbi:hypothetical protein V6N11_002134 [Hibiscus sabdariffa]|uniref:Uncharacterized protein n=1 Tax=Hibiscus sabdariffa TaxID=183260 RepID=A0ABR2QUJ3_9ROSI
MTLFHSKWGNGFQSEQDNDRNGDGGVRHDWAVKMIGDGGSREDLRNFQTTLSLSIIQDQISLNDEDRGRNKRELTLFDSWDAVASKGG